MSLLLNSIFVNFNEFFYGTVIRSFNIIRKEAGRKFFHTPVILNAFTADTFTAARFPGAVTVLKIFSTLAFSHDKLPFEVVSMDKPLYQKESRIKNIRFRDSY